MSVRWLAEGATFRVKGTRVGTGEVVPSVGPPSAPSQQPNADAAAAAAAEDNLLNVVIGRPRNLLLLVQLVEIHVNRNGRNTPARGSGPLLAHCKHWLV